MNMVNNGKSRFIDTVKGFFGVPMDNRCSDYCNHISYLSRAITVILLLVMSVMVLLMLFLHHSETTNVFLFVLLLSAVAIILIRMPVIRIRMDGYFALFLHYRRIGNPEFLIIPLLYQDTDNDGEYMYRSLNISCLDKHKDRTCYLFAQSVLQDSYLYLECIYQFDEDVSAAFHADEVVSEYMNILDTLTLYISTQNGENVDMPFLEEMDNRIKALVAVCEGTDGFVRTDLEDRFLSDKNI